MNCYENVKLFTVTLPLYLITTTMISEHTPFLEQHWLAVSSTT